MSENAQQNAIRERRLAVAQEELAKFELKEIEFRKRDRQERAAELNLPIDKIKVH